MVTFVGNQENFADALKELIELEYGALDAYEAAIKRLDNPEYLQHLEKFANDHRRHIEEISIILQNKNYEVPEKNIVGKSLLTTGKVIIADLIGDTTNLQAIKSNEIDTNIAYERMQNHKDKWKEAEDIISQGLTDEKNHKKWFDQLDFEGKWDKLVSSVKESWSDLTSQDLESVKGKKDHLINLIAEKYGETKEAIKDKIDVLTKKFD